MKKINPVIQNPTEWDQLSWKRLPSHRNLHCWFYETCLDHAASLHWQSWSCYWCRFRKTERRDHELRSKQTLSKEIPQKTKERKTKILSTIFGRRKERKSSRTLDSQRRANDNLPEGNSFRPRPSRTSRQISNSNSNSSKHTQEGRRKSLKELEKIEKLTKENP